MGYYLGLDMGTSTVGWAVTDENYKLIKKRGKDLWGIREFEEAKTSADRRSHRIARRLRQREQVRIGLLKDYFHEALEKVDPSFLMRLENSKYLLKDKDIAARTPNAIFNDKDYHDKDYYKQYPTIFHLRAELIRNPEPHDVRLVYLALLNMFKHRGHFLNATLSNADNGTTMEDAYRTFSESITESEITESEMELSFPALEDTRKIEEILSNRDYSKTVKSEKLSELFSCTKTEKKKTAFIKAMCGLSVDARVMFELDTDEAIKFSFSDSSYEDKTTELSAAVGEDNYQIIENLKAVYDCGLLSSILKGGEYLSFARVRDYETHKQDLKKLKKLYKKYKTQEEYNQMFRANEGVSYSAYIGSNNSENHTHRRDYKKDQKSTEAFYKKIKKDLEGINDPLATEVLNSIATESFMPKQLTSANGVIPNQVHKREMRKILENARGYLPFLNETGESGKPKYKELLELFSFQVPYYIGPVTEESQKHGGNGWVVRKEQGAVRPWNIEQKIDIRATSEEFITRLIRKCSYLSGESVLPKSSLLYQKYCVLNEINNLKYEGRKLSVELKQDIYRDLYETHGKVNRKTLERYLKNRISEYQNEALSGIDQTLNNALTSHYRLKGIFGDTINTDSGRVMAEDIIFQCTVFGDSGKQLMDSLKERFPELSEDVLKQIRGCKFKDWGRLSKAFLELEGVDKETGEVLTIISALWNTNYNLMELIHSDRFTFEDSLKEKETRGLASLRELTPDFLEDFYFSAPVKKMIWQTILIIREIEKVMGEAPEKVFLEVTRSDEEKGDSGRTVSRKNQLLELYRKVQDETHNWKELIENEDSSGRLRSKKMYLYLKQMGRDMYTGKPIDLERLFDDNLYDIDHIYPRHFVKDDNLENNLVLVNKPDNAAKKDEYPLPSTIRNNQSVRALWSNLHALKLMNDEKYNRLTGTQPFSEEQQADFIARQLVETSQAAKGIADIMKEVLPDTTVVYSKARNVTEFRDKMGFPKTRLLNDFHHANDAYLNIVVGNVYDTKFTQDPRRYIREEYAKRKSDYNLGRMFDFDVRRGNRTAWIAPVKGGDQGTVVTVREMMSRKTPLLTRQSYVGHGKIAEATLYNAKKATAKDYIPIKGKDLKLQEVTEYGGLSGITAAFFFLVEHDGKKGRIRTLETIPIYKAKLIDKDSSELVKYCVQNMGLKNPSVRIKEIKLQSLIKINGYYVYISGTTGTRIRVRNAVQMTLEGFESYVRLLEKTREKNRLLEGISREKNLELYDALFEKHTETIFANRPNPVKNVLQGKRVSFEELSINDQCEVLLQIIGLSKIGVVSADLRLIGGAQNAGVMLIGSNITEAKECKLITQSPTGLFSKSIDLLSV